MPYRRKLIEVALPLEAINIESAREKSIRHGHPSTLHLWWARRPLAACRAVLFSQLVDDPSEYMPDEVSANAERERLFDLIEDLVKWENINNEDILDRAKLEIARSVARDLGVEAPVGKHAIREFLATKAPPVRDPFAGGGSIPLEAQRLGLRTYASDLNPVAVLINKAMIEIPPKYANLPPLHPTENKEQQLNLIKNEWKGTEGLAEDIRYYGHWMRDEAEKRIGQYYPKYKITQSLLDEQPDLQKHGLQPGKELKVIAWLWARTIRCPNPGCGATLPLISTFWLSLKKNNYYWIKPVMDDKFSLQQIRFTIQNGEGEPPSPPKVGRGAQFACLACNQIASEENLRSQFIKKESWHTLIAIVAETSTGRVFLPPTDYQDSVAKSIEPPWKPEEEMNVNVSDLVSGRGYGFTHWHELFTPRQLLGLDTFCQLLHYVQSKIIDDIKNNHSDQFIKEYSIAIMTYLGMAISRLTDIYNAFCRWEVTRTQVRNLFTRQAIPMMWDFAEPNLFSNAAGDFETTLGTMINVIKCLPGSAPGEAKQQNAIDSMMLSKNIISSDPPYYDNINYADLSDFFYIWLRKNLRNLYPDIFATLLVPKSQELIAAPYRFGGDREKAKQFFESGMTEVLKTFRHGSIATIPVTIYYAYKQTEEIESGRSSTGWETFLESIVSAGFSITGTWPIRTELANRMLASETNALASSVVLVCRPRLSDAPITTLRDFIYSLKQELPKSLRKLQLGSIAPVDLAQAVIGPGMAIYSRYSRVIDSDGSPITVRSALALINQALDEFLAEQEGDYDSDTRWALAWYEQYGHEQGSYGVAETLSKAKNTSVEGLEEAGILEARAGKVRLLRRDELDSDWNPLVDKRITVWETCHHLLNNLENEGEQSAGGLLKKIGGLSEAARDLAYRLYSICDRKGWAQYALGYNMLVVAWPRLKELARGKAQPMQERF